MAAGQEALTDELEELQRQLRDVAEERDSWKVRCLRAETEVRALKRQSKLGLAIDTVSQLSTAQHNLSGYASPNSLIESETDWRRSSNGGLSVASGITDRLCTPAIQTDVTVFRLKQELGALQEQHRSLEASNDELKEAYKQQQEQQQQLANMPRGMVPSRPFAISCDSGGLESPEELRLKLKEKNEAIMQLQSDMVRDNRLIEKQKRAVETKHVLCSEELLEMTERAKSLSEQVNRSRKKGTELQAAREEMAKLNSHYEECESKLAEESQQLQYRLDEVSSELNCNRKESETAHEEQRSLQDAVGSAHAELHKCKERSLLRGNEHVMLESRLAAYSREASEATEQKAAAILKLEEIHAAAAGENGWQAKQQKVTQGVSLIRQLCGDLQKEIRTDRDRGDRARSPLEKLATTSSRRASNGSNDTSSVSDKVMTRLMKHVEKMQLVLDQPVPKMVGRAVSPEGEHPQPEEHRKIYQLLNSDTNEVLQQELNDFRLEAASDREKMITEHCEELDDLVGCFNRERRDLHEQIQRLSDKCAKAEVAGAAARPMSEIRTHVESQVANMKRELVSQFSDVSEREREKRRVDEHELEQMQQTLEKCQINLIASQEEFAILSALFDQERRENLQLKSSQRVLELQLEAEKEVGPHRNVSTASSLLQVPGHERAHPIPHHSSGGNFSTSSHHAQNPSHSLPPTALPPQALVATAGGVTTSANFSSIDGTPFPDERVTYSNRSPDVSGSWDMQLLHPTTLSQQSDAHMLTPQGGTPTVTPPRVVTPFVGNVSAPPPALAQRAWTEGSEAGGSTPGAVTTPSRPTPTGPLPPRRGPQATPPVRTVA